MMAMMSLDKNFSHMIQGFISEYSSSSLSVHTRSALRSTLPKNVQERFPWNKAFRVAAASIIQYPVLRYNGAVYPFLRSPNTCRSPHELFSWQ